VSADDRARRAALFDHLYQPAYNLKAVALTDREAQVIGCLLDEMRAGEFGDLARDMSNRINNRLRSAGVIAPHPYRPNLGKAAEIAEGDTAQPDGPWNGIPDAHLDTVADGREQI
jgi:hypothetical protein